jgi:hypothetical protein
VEAAVGVLKVMGRSGDSKVIWDHRNKAETDAARAQFDTLTRSGFKAYSVRDDGTGKKGEPLKAFDPKAEAVILVPPMAGG